MERENKNLLGFLGMTVFITGLFSVAADVLSGWSADPRGMSSAVSVNLETVQFLFLNKPRWQYVLGNYFGTFLIPIFHLIGMYLIAIAIKPIGKWAARIFLFGGAYITAIGSGLHGTLAFVGDIVLSGNESLRAGILDYWQPWAYALVVCFVLISVFLAYITLSRKTHFPRWTFFTSPLSMMIISTLLIFILPKDMAGFKSFLAVTGLNLPLLIFYLTTLGVLFKQREMDFSI